MDQSLHSYMRLGLVQDVAFPAGGDDPEAFLDGVEQIAADDFFAAIEVRCVPDDGLRPRVVEVLRASQLGVVYAAYPRLCAPGFDLSSLDDAARSRAVEAGKGAIDEAIALGAERVTVVSGPDPGGEGRDGGTEALIDSLCALAAYSTAHCGPPLALEPLPRGGEGGHLIGPTADASGIVRLVREMFPDFGLTLDTGHLALLGEDVAAAFAAAAPYLEQVHLANVVPGAGTAAPQFGVAGGLYDVPRVADVLLALFRVGFLGAGRRPLVCVRVAPRPGERPAWVIAGAKRTLAAAWARL
jgi:sugar phosphate isomerase/epimerase